MMTLTTHNDHTVGTVLAVLFLAFGIALATPSYGADVTATSDSGLFLPNQYTYYNPLKNGLDNPDYNHSTERLTMDTESLLRAAEQIRSTHVSPEQRALNHQWLQHNAGVDEPRVGGRVFSALVRMGFKTFWEINHQRYDKFSHVLPDSQGNGRITKDVDYKLRVSDDKVKLSFEYEF